MGKALTFGPLALFAYQVFLAYTGNSPLTVYDLLPHNMLVKLVSVVTTGPYHLIVQFGQLFDLFGF